MSAIPENIHPVFDRILQRADKEKFLHQSAKVIWFTGLSGSGKSTLAEMLEKKLHSENFFTQVLDGDNIRTGINSNLRFSEDDRRENIRRIAEVSKLFLHCGIITINSFVSPTSEIRALAKSIIGDKDFLEIFIDCPLEICEARDVKGLYAKARRGEIPDFTGVTSPFEPPLNPLLTVHTDRLSAEEALSAIYEAVYPFIKQTNA